MTNAIRITREIFQVGGDGLTAPGDAAVYLINFSGQAALIDAGCGRANRMLIDYIQACGIRPHQIKYLLITHCHYDHAGGARYIRDTLACTVVAHELDAEFLERGDDTVTAATWYGENIQPLTVDRQLSGKEEEIHLGDGIIKAIHVPGHSPGSVVYLTESDGLKVLFAQDVHGPLDASFRSNREDYLNSLKELLALEVDILCEGHYGIYRGKNEVKEFISSFLAINE